MQGNTIKELRKSGRLEEALKLALTDYEEYPEIPYTATNLAWVYDAWCKHYAEKGDFQRFADTFQKLKDLNVLHDNQMLSNTLCWRFRSLLATIAQQGSNETIAKTAAEAFEMVKALNPEKPGEAYSVLFKAFYKIKDYWPGHKEFCDWWDFTNFRKEDYEGTPLPNGKKGAVSTAESAYISYAKELTRRQDEEAVRRFLPVLEQVDKTHPEMTYIGYYIGILLLQLKHEQDALNVLRPFARKKQREFWVWKLLAQTQETNSDACLACLIRAVNCGTKENFLIKVRQELAQAFIQRHNYKSARSQIEHIRKCCMANGFKIPFQIQQWTRESWFNTPDCTDEHPVSFDYMEMTDELLFEDKQAITGIATQINTEKKTVSVIYGKEKAGFLSYGRFLKLVRVGDVLKIRPESIAASGYIKPLKVSILPDGIPDCDFYGRKTGKVISNRQQTVFFLKWDNGEAYIPVQLAKELSVVPGDRLRACVVRVHNPKRDSWGWRCLTAERANTSNE